MNYSRRQLEAFGEPLGESVTRKEGGRIIYGGGGSSSPPSTQTQIAELPDWARPYAQETLAKTKALTAAPYQQYNAPRIAGFSPLQEQAMQGVAGMQPSGLGQFGGAAAGAATMGALGTQYRPFQMGQFTSGRAAQYMNPFLEQAMEPQLREAARSSEMQRNMDQARAVGQGAFGGSRQAIVEAERQRNLGTQMGDIRARGYQTAFDQAQQNFAREQQLREQSRQYGAGLGMQGLQTALQGAGQLGALGGQEFGQQKDILGMQSQMGAQQQALRQQGLTQSYQDFLNEQNYPYKQLGFMSDMIRGLPLGQQSTKQLYEAPGNLAGQIAGIGTGLLGVSSMGRMFNSMAEGGVVDGYAEGGVTSEENVDSIIDGLSDVQLQQAKAAAINRGDQERVDAIDAEIAQRTSLRAGLGAAFDSLPYDSRQRVVSAASGGMVAFSNGGVSPEFGIEDPAAAEMDRLRVQETLARRAQEEQNKQLEFLRTSAPEVYARKAAERTAAPAAEPAAAPYDRATATRREDYAKPALTRQNATEVVKTITEAAKVKVPEDRTQELSNTLFSQMMERSKPERDAFNAELAKIKGRAKEIEARGLGEAIAKFGFGWAKAAAKPGRRKGVAGVVESAAEASPLISESLAETQKLKSAAEDNYMKMRMDNARYQSALEQGNMQLAATMASNISQRQLAAATLQEQIAQHERMYGLEKEKIGIQRSQANAPTAIQKIASDLMAADPNLDRKSALTEASKLAGYSFRTDSAAGGKLAAELRKIDEDFSTLKFLDPKSKMAENLAAQRQQRIAEAYRLYGAEQPGVTSPQTPGAGAGQMRIVGVR